MSTLLLIRHGQASLGADDYDRLSPLGEQQGRSLGQYLAQMDRRFDRVFVGPRLRHRQTHDAAAGELTKAELPLPEAEHLGTFDEHQCPEVLAHHQEHLASRLGLGAGSEDLGSYLKLFRQGSLMWVRGELETPDGLEDWRTFRRRIQDELEGIRRRVTEPRARVVVFTSGGAVAAAVGIALGLDDEKIIEISWSIRNGSLTELHFSKRGFGVAGFNAVPFRDPKLLTYV